MTTQLAPLSIQTFDSTPILDTHVHIFVSPFVYLCLSLMSITYITTRKEATSEKDTRWL